MKSCSELVAESERLGSYAEYINKLVDTSCTIRVVGEERRHTE